VDAAADCTTQSYDKSRPSVGSITSGGKHVHPATEVARVPLTVLSGQTMGGTDPPVQ